MASLSEAEYFVLFCKDDEQFCTVSKEDVIFDATLSEGEAVPFFWNSEKNTGVVHHWGVDFNQCVKIAERLAKVHNHLSKKKASFHAGSPRKAKKKCTELLQKKVSQPVVTRSKAEPSKRKSKEFLKDQREDQEQLELLSRSPTPSASRSFTRIIPNDDSGDETSMGPNVSHPHSMVTDEEESSSGESKNENSDKESVSSDSPSENERKPSKKKQRLSAERKDKYEEEIKRLSLELKKHSEAAGASPASSSQAPKSSSAQKPNNSTPKPSSSPLTPSSATKPSSSASKPKGSEGAYHFHIVASRTFPGKMFNYDELSEECVELMGPKGATGIFCGKDAYESAEAGTTATMVARRLLEGVFTEEALRSCSLTGLPPRGKGKAAYEKTEVIRPHLDPRGAKAIIDQALEWQKAKYMRPKKEPSQIRTAISIRLCDFANKKE